MRDNLEFLSIFNWLFIELSSRLVKEPSLIVTIVAVIPDNVSLRNISSVLDIEATSSVVSDVLQTSFMPLNVLI
jgi:hypothetical protein